jgi:hypothetical protein
MNHFTHTEREMVKTVGNHRPPILVLAVYFFLSVLSSTVFGASNETFERINLLYKTVETNDGKSLPALWALIDQAVVDFLNSGNDANSLRVLFSELPDDEQDDEVPSYSSKSLEVNGTQYVLGIYKFGYWFNGSGRISLYTQRGGAWSRTDAFDGGYPILFYSFPEAFHRGYFFTLEWFIGADRQEGSVRSWLINEGQLVTQGDNYKGLVDFSVKTNPSSLVCSFSRYADNLCESNIGERLEYELIFQLNERGKIVAANHSLRPWLEVWNECLGYIRKNDLKNAARFIEGKKTLSRLHHVFHNYCSRITAQAGDLVTGVAYIEIPLKTTDSMSWRISFKRVNQVWRIISITDKKRNE